MAKKVVLACALCMSRNYSTNKNNDSKSERLQARKYCKKCGEHTLHQETK